ncbi:MAG: AMP-binding protein [Nanoarchaeota archaeon]|nr:AMP-binding protein [Nanoarchaeota archaeon]
MSKEGISSIQELIENFLLTNQDKILFAHKKGYRTYTINGKELFEKVQKTRVFLKNKNIESSDKIIILGTNSIEWITVYFACILSGIIVVPLDTLTDKLLLKKIQKQVKAKAIFQDRGLASIGFVPNKIKQFYLDELDNILKNVNIDTRANLPTTKTRPNDILEIIYTSGTTSNPKGVILTNENITAGVNAAISSISLKIRLRMLNLLPLSHIFGQIQGLFLLMHFNHKIFFLDSIQPRKIISFIKNKKINGVALVPGILSALKKELEGKSVLLNLGVQFRLIGVGGASLDTELERWWKRRLIIVIQGYGLTETASVVSVNKIGASKTGSVGKVYENLEIKLGKDNEILVKGKNVTPGYFNDQIKTKQAFEDGWFKTGDIGEIKNSYLYLKERKKDIIITPSGLNVYPKDIESTLNKIPVVEESSVLEKDKKIHAVLILKEKADISEVVKKANEKLLSHQKITGYSVWPYKDFPKTHTGKVKKHIILQEISKLKTKPHSYENKLYNVINNVLKSHQKINLKSKLSDLGMDSLRRVELISELEKEFDVEINEVKLNQFTKVSDIEEIMKESHIQKIKFKKWPISSISRLVRYVFQKLLVFPLLRIFTKTDYYGLENLRHIEKLKKPVIFASNHQSALDSPVIIKKLQLPIAIPADSNYVFGIGTEGPFILRLYKRLRGYLIALFFNAYPFGETIGTNTSLEFTGEMLDNGYSILIFPEAHRTTDGKIKAFKSGIGYLALNMQALIIPVKIKGLYEILTVRKTIPKFGKSKVIIGKPITPEKLKDLSYINATKLIEEKVKEL